MHDLKMGGHELQAFTPKPKPQLLSAFSWPYADNSPSHLVAYPFFFKGPYLSYLLILPFVVNKL